MTYNVYQIPSGLNVLFSFDFMQRHCFCAVADPGSLSGGGANLKLAREFRGECGSASLYGGLGALPPVRSRGKAPGQGGKAPHEAEVFHTTAVTIFG